MKNLTKESYLAILFYISMSISFFIKSDFIGTGLSLGVGTVVVIILYCMQHRCKHPLMQMIKELF